jgi:DNA-binding HxlR family transcriptional regulator
MPYERKRPRLDPCPVEEVVELIGGKWKARILRVLADGPQTFGGARKKLGGVTQQVLSAQLKSLEADGLVVRARNGAEPSAGSTYRLTDEASTLLPVLDVLARWGAARLRRKGLRWSPAQWPSVEG